MKSTVTVALLGALAGLGAGGVAAAVALQTVTPASLSHPAVTPGQARVASMAFDDARSVELAPTLGPVPAIVSQQAGVLTASTCTPGGSISSGKPVASIAGRPFVALAASMPQYQPIATGTRGADVKALTAELARLKKLDAATDTATDATVAALAQLAGLPEGTATIAPGMFAWIPGPSATWTTCEASVGTTLSPGASLGKLVPALDDVHLKATPSNAVAGARTVTIGKIKAPIADGRIADKAVLTQIAASDEFAAYQRSEGQGSLGGTWALATPMKVGRVPAAAIVTAGGTCVVSNGRPVAVTVVSSQLGQSLVTSKDGLPESVDFPAADGATCR